MPTDDEIVAEEAARVMHHLSACSNGSLMTDYMLSGDDLILRKIDTIARGKGYGTAKCIMGDKGAVVDISDVRNALMLAYRAGARREAKRPPLDPRPSDMAELARLTAIELRKVPILAESDSFLIGVWRFKGCMCTGTFGDVEMYVYNMYQDIFDNLNPRECADVIQAEERKRAQEWAGDL